MRRIGFAIALMVTALAAPAAHAASIVFIKGGNVWLASADGSVQRQVTSSGGWRFVSQADDGTILAQTGTELVRLDRAGSTLAPAFATTFTGAPASWNGPVSPVISPDGAHQAYGGMITDSGVYDYTCGCTRYTDQFSTWWGSASSYSQPNQTLGQEDYVDPAWIDDSHLLMSATEILIDQVATYTLGGADNSEVQWFTDPDQSVQQLTNGAITRSGDKLAFVANVQGGIGNEIRIYSTTGPPPEAAGDPANVPVDTCNIGPNNFESLRVSFSPDGQSLVYDAPDGIHQVTLSGWPSCAGLTDRLIIPGGSEPYFGPADVASGGGGGGGSGGGGGTRTRGLVAFSLTHHAVARGGKITLTIVAGGAGTLIARASVAVSASHHHGHTRAYGSSTLRLGRGGKVVLTIRPTRTTAIALAHSGRVTVTIAISFTPVGGSPRMLRTSVRLSVGAGGRR